MTGRWIDRNGNQAKAKTREHRRNHLDARRVGQQDSFPRRRGRYLLQVEGNVRGSLKELGVGNGLSDVPFDVEECVEPFVGRH